MNNKTGLLSIIVVLLSFLTICCTNVTINQPYSVISGIVTPESYYSKSTFIDKDTVGSVFENNSLDYWIIGTNPNNKEMTSFRENIRGINKRLKDYHSTELSVAAENDVSSSSIPTIWNINGNNTALPPLYRETNRNILYETFRIKYDGSLVNHFDDYIALLDSGYIIAPIPCSEIIGPEWNINNGLRMNLIIRSEIKNQVVDALANRRLFISSGDDINMSFSINDNKIGSIIKTYDDLNIQYRVTNHDAKIKAVEVISNNGEIVFAQHDIDENDKSGKFQLSNVNDFAYFYLKSYFENGETAFTAPIWIVREKKAIINNITN
ncbi:MAG: hypothetical protein J6W76_04110, partial [Spirochaetales bacterium]|nr:hypothetical protein [Spirochaetales bacterium]